MPRVSMCGNEIQKYLECWSALRAQAELRGRERYPESAGTPWLFLQCGANEGAARERSGGACGRRAGLPQPLLCSPLERGPGRLTEPLPR